ncbi:hypothetical protein NC652_019530 [Populus alba x Populus x berolinensis]|nr:hypothetical protein NC652_019530 [Populus alba x Populus x berolinensis]
MTTSSTTHSRKPRNFLYISMASLLSFSLFSLFLFLSLSSSSTTTLKTNSHHPAKPKQKPRPNVPPSSASTTPPEILQACKATRFQDTCVSSLSNPNVPRNPTPLQIIQSAISVSNTNLKTAQSMVKSILDSSAGNINRTTAAKNCVEALINSQYRITRSTDDALPRGRVKDARAWMGAALLYQYDCSNALKYANDTSLTRQTMSFLDTLMAFSSNALSMIVSYDAFGNETKSWGPPKTERDGVWELGSAPGSGGDFGSGFRGGFPSELTADVTVCKDTSNGGCYKTVQEAVNTAPDNEWGHRYVIHIKEGVYNEIVRVPLEKKNVVFLGDGMGKTVITGSLAVGQPGISTYNTATVASWRPPQTERDGFWEDSVLDSVRGFFRGGFPSKLTADATVCKDESKDNGCYKTVQEAVNAAPDNAMDRRFVIHIKEGVYEEIVRVPLEKKNVVFLGDGMGKSVITGSLSVGQIGVTTYESATVGVLGDGFMASGLTIQNTAGAPTHQAVAFRSDSDLSIIENCEFLGNQDTLYAHSLRQFYKSCHIEGNVDFIFGNSAAIFQDCQILIRPRQVKPEKGENNAVTAHGRTDPAQSTGFVFQNCLINGTEEYMALYRSKPSVHKNFLGRPWKEFSRTVFIHCNLEALLTPQGWMPWSGDFALKTLYYGEFENSGPGSDSSQRVTWSSQIPAEHVATYSVQNFIQGDEWIPTSS